MKTMIKYLCLMVLIVLVMPMAVEAYDIVVFEDYDKTYFMDGDVLRVEKDLTLRNVGNNPIIPGDIRFRMYEVLGGETVPSEIDELQATDGSRELESRVESYDDYSSIIVSVYNPLLPGYDYQMTVSYEIDFNPTGILFHEMIFPIEETTTPIRDSTTRLVMPNHYKVTFAPDAEISSDSMRQTIEWDGDSDLMLEYTRLPLPRMPFRMVSVFWLIILAILGVLFIYLNSRRPDKRKRRK